MITILIIDDDPNITETLGDILDAKGYNVHSYDNGKDGLAFVRSQFIHVAIVDMRLPDMSGQSVLSELKVISPDTETIVFTGYGSLKSAVEAIKTQAFAYLLKPIDPDILLRTIENCVEKQQLLLMLRESEHRFRMQFMHFPVPAYIWQKTNNDFLLKDYNIYAEKISEGRIKENLQIKAQEFYLNQPQVLDDMYKCFKNKTIIRREIPFEFKTTGEKRFFNTLYSFIPPDLLLVYTEDITEKKRVEHIRIELEDRRANFISMTSHELRTPLTAIMGFLEILEDRLDELDQERKDKCLKIIKRNVFRLERLVDGVSDLAKIEQGFFDLNLKDIDLSDFIENVTQAYKPFLGNELEVIHHHKHFSALIEGDVDRLNQVLDNIINNAIKHTSKNSRKIIVTSEIHPNVVKVIISDNGAGIPPKNLKQLFNPFTSFPTKYSAGGSGIGLYLSRRIIEEHKGTLIAKSEGKDCGTSFIIDLPRKFAH
ncbi:MAG: response regulator [Candidatus Hodarchaeales archaeon]|jgi:signal transduction histidine kinase/ActR/RegA family two-component response regulator